MDRESEGPSEDSFQGDCVVGHFVTERDGEVDTASYEGQWPGHCIITASERV